MVFDALVPSWLVFDLFPRLSPTEALLLLCEVRGLCVRKYRLRAPAGLLQPNVTRAVDGGDKQANVQYSSVPSSSVGPWRSVRRSVLFLVVPAKILL